MSKEDGETVQLVVVNRAQQQATAETTIKQKLIKFFQLTKPFWMLSDDLIILIKELLHATLEIINIIIQVFIASIFTVLSLLEAKEVIEELHKDIEKYKQNKITRMTLLGTVFSLLLTVGSSGLGMVLLAGAIALFFGVSLTLLGAEFYTFAIMVALTVHNIRIVLKTYHEYRQTTDPKARLALEKKLFFETAEAATALVITLSIAFTAFAAFAAIAGVSAGTLGLPLLIMLIGASIAIVLKIIEKVDEKYEKKHGESFLTKKRNQFVAWLKNEKTVRPEILAAPARKSFPGAPEAISNTLIVLESEDKALGHVELEEKIDEVVVEVVIELLLDENKASPSRKVSYPDNMPLVVLSTPEPKVEIAYIQQSLQPIKEVDEEKTAVAPDSPDPEPLSSDDEAEVPLSPSDSKVNKQVNRNLSIRRQLFFNGEPPSIINSETTITLNRMRSKL